MECKAAELGGEKDLRPDIYRFIKSNFTKGVLIFVHVFDAMMSDQVTVSSRLGSK